MAQTALLQQGQSYLARSFVKVTGLLNGICISSFDATLRENQLCCGCTDDIGHNALLKLS